MLCFVHSLRLTHYLPHLPPPPSIQYTLKWKGKKSISDLAIPSFMGHGLAKYGMGDKRSLEQFYEISGLDMERQKVTRPNWCVHGKNPKHHGEYKWE
jgi:hypothetical protein